MQSHHDPIDDGPVTVTVTVDEATAMVSALALFAGIHAPTTGKALALHKVLLSGTEKLAKATGVPVSATKIVSALMATAARDDLSHAQER